MHSATRYLNDCIELLSALISTPSFSDMEEKAADLWHEFLSKKGAGNVKRFHNNVYVIGSGFDPNKPILMLNSHLDTVKPSPSYTKDPFIPVLENGCLYGLGSNDAGGAGVSLAATFLALKDEKNLPVNLLLAITASEERMGELGMRAFLPHLREQGLYPDMAIVGEPTSMQPAIAERGLVVLDAYVKGKAGHAARDEGINAIYRAIHDISLLQNLSLPKQSEVLGPLKVNVTIIKAGSQHNVVPDSCEYVVDVRTTDAYPNEMIADLLTKYTEWSKFTPRSTRIKPSVLSYSHPLYLASEKMGLKPFVSPTTSDMALMPDIPSLKIGPGDSARSHAADEFIKISEIEEALSLYPRLIRNISF